MPNPMLNPQVLLCPCGARHPLDRWPYYWCGKSLRTAKIGDVVEVDAQDVRMERHA